MVEFREYDEQDYSGVLECLHRNYEWMGKCSLMEIAEWFQPIVDYHWSNDKALQGRSLHGYVLLDEGRVVGYFGTIYSLRRINSKERTMVNLSCWATDEAYRGRIIPYISKIYENADFVTDFWPNIASVLMSKSLFKMRTLENRMISMLPVPYLDSFKLSLHFIGEEAEIDDDVIRMEYRDHKMYPGIALVQIKVADQTGYVFYRTFHDQGEWIRILKIDHIELFVKYTHEIVWRIFIKEFYHKFEKMTEIYSEVLMRVYNDRKVCMECDERLFGGYKLDYPAQKSKKIMRLVRNNCGDDYTPDNLYSEFVLFPYNM